MEYYGIWAARGGGSVFGAAEAWSKRDGVPEVFTARAEAQAQAERYNKSTASVHVRYFVKEMEPALAKSALRDMEKAAAAQNRTAAVLDTVHGYEVKRAVCFSNDKGFALAENPRAAAPFVTWQFTEDNGKREYYWGHYFAKEASAEKDYGKRTDEYRVDYPALTEKYNYLAAAEMGSEQNYNMIDGVVNNLPVPEPPYIGGCNIASACNSRFEGMVAFVGTDDNVYIGKKENYDSRGHYDNSDGSLVYVSDNKQTYHFMYSDGQYATQAEALYYGYKMEDFAEFARIQAGVLAAFLQKRDFLFDGQPFLSPDSEAFREQVAALEAAGGAKPFWDMVAERIDRRPQTKPGEKPSITKRLEAAKVEATRQATSQKSVPRKNKEAEL